MMLGTRPPFLSGFFFLADQPTQYQETHPTLNEKKRGWPKRSSCEKAGGGVKQVLRLRTSNLTLGGKKSTPMDK